MDMAHHVHIKDGVGDFRPIGEATLVEAVDLIAAAITYCRDRDIPKLLIVATGLTGVSIPTLVDRFLMAEEWAGEARGMVAAAMVVNPEYIHPQKFGVQVATDFGFTVDVFPEEPDAAAWLLSYQHPV